MGNAPTPAGRECYHCKLWVGPGEFHDCWTTTEAALTEDLSDDLRDAWERIRECAAELGEQRIYASGSCIMFARDTCYLFVRPKKSLLEVTVFLGREVHAPQIARTERKSKTKVAHIVKVRHRDEVEPPLTAWFEEAYALQDALAAAAKSATKAPTRSANAKAAAPTRSRTAAVARKAATRR